jgi:polar amino acid transport system substrate-binding protein
MLRIVLSLLAGLALPLAAQAQTTVKLMANTSPPYADVKLPEQGLALELVRHVFEGTDYAPDITIDNWSRSVEGARLGVYDGLAAAWYSDERAADLLFSEPYLSSELIVLKRRDNPNVYDELPDLAGARLGVRTDYAYGVDFSGVPGLTLVEENHLIQNLLNLLNGSVDLVIGDRRTVNLQLREYLRDSINRFGVTAIELPPVARHVAISRSLDGHEAIIKAFNAALAARQKDGSHGAIVQRWEDLYADID